jgi:MTH538 TIR-like domain (DUF1863)
MTAYRAFLSYSHRDVHLARRLHRELEGLELPRALRQGNPRRPCAPIFRDRDELGAHSGLTSAVQRALDSAERLIVLCSAHSTQSQWVEAEVAHFLAHTPDRPVIAVIGDGDDGSDAHPGYVPSLQRLSEQGQLLVVDARTQALGFVGGVEALAASMTGIAPLQIERSQRARRRRSLALSTFGFGFAALLMALSTYMLAVVAQGTLNSIRYAYATMSEVFTGIREISALSNQPGPVMRLNSQVLESVNATVDEVWRDTPALDGLPGSNYLHHLLDAGLKMERSRVASALEADEQALSLAQQGRVAADRLLQPGLARLAYGLGHRIIFPGDVSAEMVRQRTDAQAWWTLSTAQAGVGMDEQALQSVSKALAAARQSLNKDGDNDMTQLLVIAESYAVKASDYADGDINWRAASAAAADIVEQLPVDGKYPNGVEKATIKAEWQARIHAARARAAAIWRDEATAGAAVIAAETALDHIEKNSPNPFFTMLVRQTVSGARLRLAKTPTDWTRLRDASLQARDLFKQLEFKLPDQQWVGRGAANNLMTLALAQSHLGEPFTAARDEGLTRVRELVALAPGNIAHKGSLADLLVDTVDIETRSGSCAAARQARTEATALYNELLAQPKNRISYQRRLAELQATSPCDS